MNSVSKKQNKKTSPKARKWVFDIFYMKKDKNGRDSKDKIIDIDWSKVYSDYKDIIRYLIVQKEKGDKHGRLHWQGYIQLYNQCRTRKIQTITTELKIKHFCEPARGSAEENKAYCTKMRTSQNEFYEFGKAVSQGCRSDLEDIKKCLDDGGNLNDIANNHFGDFIRYHNGFRAYKSLIDKKTRQKRRNVEVELRYGDTGTGKTQGVLDKHGDDKVFIIDFNGAEWWDGYDGEDIILIDDYNNDIKINRLLRLLDKYKVRLPIKGGFTWANWTKIYITTNLTLDELHAQAKPEHRRALMRRIKVKKQFKKETTKVSPSVLGNIESRTLDLKNKNQIISDSQDISLKKNILSNIHDNPFSDDDSVP